MLADPDKVKKLEDEVTNLEQTLENHRHDAQESHNYYTEVVKHCKNDWKKIEKLQERLL